jgi:hypothetical protein
MTDRDSPLDINYLDICGKKRIASNFRLVAIFVVLSFGFLFVNLKSISAPKSFRAIAETHRVIHLHGAHQVHSNCLSSTIKLRSTGHVKKAASSFLKEESSFLAPITSSITFNEYSSIIQTRSAIIQNIARESNLSEVVLSHYDEKAAITVSPSTAFWLDIGQLDNAGAIASRSSGKCSSRGELPR